MSELTAHVQLVATNTVQSGMISGFQMRFSLFWNVTQHRMVVTGV
jgi:hypothetical protein